MQKSTRKIVISLVCAISLILISYPIWRYASGSKVGILANSYGDLPLSIDMGTFEPLVIVDDEMSGTVINDTNISIKNRNGYDKKTNLYILVEKISTIPYQFIRVAIDDEVYRLNELDLEEDENNYYFYLKEVEIKAYEDQNLKVRIWLSQETEGVDPTATLVTNFVTK